MHDPSVPPSAARPEHRRSPQHPARVRALHRLLARALLALFVGIAGLGGPLEARGGKCPNLVIVLDRSGSMDAAPDGSSAPPGGSRWEIAVKALKELVDTYDGQLPIGLSLFASDGSCAGGKLNIPPAYDTAAQIKMTIEKDSPISATPTSETIENLRKEAVLRDPSRQHFLLLLTDGEPNCATGEPGATITALDAARMQSPSIKTFVLGFGALPTTAAATMDQMAVAGGTALTGTPRKYYTAEDLPTLKAALEKIFAVVFGEGSGVCDDSCYAPDVGCPNPGDLCIRGRCAPSPCAEISCGPGLYCHTDGVSPGRCVSPCKKACKTGERCEMGSCIPSACPSVCIAGFVCNSASGRCEPDPLCPENPPRREQCRLPSACQFGQCVDDPCRFVRCPAGSRCAPWNGSCEWSPVYMPPADMRSGDPNVVDGENRAGGCALPPRTDAPGAGPGALLAGLLLVGALVVERRMRRGRAQAPRGLTGS